jgi:predicted phosphodiesterase
MLVVLGDIHGGFRRIYELDKLVSDTAEAIIQVGDFGFDSSLLSTWRPTETPIYAIDGNHENFAWLSQFMNERGPVEIQKNLFYVPRGAILDIDDKIIGFAGGAASIDYKFRKLYRDWWPEEILLREQIEPLMQIEHLDYIITHAPPSTTTAQFFGKSGYKYFDVPDTWYDPSQLVIDVLKAKHPESQLICGHMHKPINDTINKVRILDINEAMEI